jgi:hypothetical protein
MKTNTVVAYYSTIEKKRVTNMRHLRKQVMPLGDSYALP